MSPYAGPCRLRGVSLTVSGSLCCSPFGSDYVAMKCLVEDEFFPIRSKYSKTVYCRATLLSMNCKSLNLIFRIFNENAFKGN